MKNITNILMVIATILTVSCNEGGKSGEKASSPVKNQEKVEEKTYSIRTAKTDSEMKYALLRFYKSITSENVVDKKDELIDDLNRITYDFAGSANLELLLDLISQFAAKADISNNYLELEVSEAIYEKIFNKELYSHDNFQFFLGVYFSERLHFDYGDEVMCIVASRYCLREGEDFPAIEKVYFPELLKRMIEINGELSQEDKEFITYEVESFDFNRGFPEFTQRLKEDILALLK